MTKEARIRPEGSLWEHRQVDLQIDPEGEGPAPIHSFGDLPLRIHGILQRGRLIDLMLTGIGGEIHATPLVVPHIARGESELESPHLARSWEVPEQSISVHVEVWIDRDGFGFADLFARRME